MFLVRKSHHWNASLDSLKELWEDMPHTVRYVSGDLDFKKMLPRFFELSWQESESGGYIDLWPLTPLAGYNWRAWPDDERDVIKACLDLLWPSALQQECSGNLHDILATAQHIELS